MDFSRRMFLFSRNPRCHVDANAPTQTHTPSQQMYGTRYIAKLRKVNARSSRNMLASWTDYRAQCVETCTYEIVEEGCSGRRERTHLPVHAGHDAACVVRSVAERHDFRSFESKVANGARHGQRIHLVSQHACVHSCPTPPHMRPALTKSITTVHAITCEPTLPLSMPMHTLATHHATHAPNSHQINHLPVAAGTIMPPKKSSSQTCASDGKAVSP